MKQLLVLLLFTAACSYKKTNQTLKGHEELYSEPEQIEQEALDLDEKRIVIASTNDIEGHLSTSVIPFQDKEQTREQVIQLGGQEVISQYFQILRDTYQNVILVDSGDLLTQGNSEEVQSFYEKNQYDAVTLGVRDFNLRVSTKDGSTINKFKSFAKSSKVPVLLSNLFELKTARTVEWEGTLPYLLKEVEGLKVGIIGLIPDDIIDQTPVQNRVGLFIENMLQSTLKNARLLRSLGADIIVVLSHQGIDCHTKTAIETKLPPEKVNFDPLKQNTCDLTSSLGQYLTRLPPGLVDVIVGGRSHQKIANLINGVVVMGGLPHGKSFNYTELVVNTKSRKINPKKTLVHQPVMFCHEFFKETNDCFYEDDSINHKERSPAYFLGKKINYSVTAQSNLPSALDQEFLIKRMRNLHGDLLFTSIPNSETQLFSLTLTGREIEKILEEDYNCGRQNQWFPSPFQLQENELQLRLSEVEIDPTKTYSIITDLESIQSHPHLRKKVKDPEAIVFSTRSWSSLEESPIASAE